jgi:hypothetical protein
MKCDRCCGEMAYEKFYGPSEYFWGWRCIFCGEIVDTMILDNRKGFPSPSAVRHRFVKTPKYKGG